MIINKNLLVRISCKFTSTHVLGLDSVALSVVCNFTHDKDFD